MKKIIASFFGILMSAMVFAESTVVVLEFQTKNKEIRDKMSIFTDIFRSELANTSSITVVDRANTDKVLNEIALQQSSVMSTDNVKSVGKMLNADYIVLGNVELVIDEAETHKEQVTTTNEVDGGLLGGAKKMLFGGKSTRTETTTETIDVTTQDKAINVVVQMLDVETSGIVASSRLAIPKWTQFSDYAEDLAKPLSQKLSFSRSLKKVDSDMFYGQWECEIENNGTIDYYTIEFGDNNRATVTVESTSRSGKTTKATGRGRYQYVADEKVFVLTVNRMTGEVSHVTRINWKSMVNPSADNNSFTIAMPVSSSATAKSVRGQFWRLE